MDESRPYARWSATPTPESVSVSTGIIQAKAELNKLHIQLADQGFNQVGEGGVWFENNIVVDYYSKPFF